MKDEIENGARQNAGEMRVVFKQWAVLYRAEMHERFTKLSRSPGSGGWPGYKKSTRRKRGNVGRASMLWDTGALLNVLDPKLIRTPGLTNKPIRFGIETGFGGPGAHPPSKRKRAKPKGKPSTASKATASRKKRIGVARLAAIHHFGEGDMPERKLLVDPSKRTMRRMVSATVKGLARIIKANQISGTAGG